MKYISLTLISACLYSCSTNIANNNIEIIIEDAHSYRYDLKHKVAVTFFVNKEPAESHFTLSPEENAAIVERYFALRLNKIGDSIFFKDKCRYMPKMYTTLIIRSGQTVQKIIIDSDCSKFYSADMPAANRVNSFLNFVWSILRKKPEISDMPKSDILYL